MFVFDNWKQVHAAQIIHGLTAATLSATLGVALVLATIALS